LIAAGEKGGSVG
jgi:hypothetical protein